MKPAFRSSRAMAKLKPGHVRGKRSRGLSTWEREAVSGKQFLRQVRDLGLRLRPMRRQRTGLPRQAIRLLWIAPSFFPRVGGLEVYNEKVAEHLGDLCEVGLVTKAGEWFPGDKRISPFTLTHIQPQGPAAWQQTAKELADVLSRFAPDLVHLGGAQVALHRRIIPESIPVLATVHGNDITLEKRNSFVGRGPSRVDALNTCEHLFAVSNHTAALARQWGITSPLSVLTAGCDIEFFRPWPTLGREARDRYHLPKGVPIILTVSRLVSGKGHLLILEAIRRLPFRVHWVVAGDGPFRDQLLTAIATSDVADQVTLVGNIFDDDLVGLYNACDLFVLTPEKRTFEDGRIYAESFGLVLLEAAACGKAVITTTDCGCKDAVIDGGTGILVPPSDPVALSQAIELVLSQPDLARALGDCGLNFVRSSGGWHRVARQLHERYQDILYGSAAPAQPPLARIPL